MAVTIKQLAEAAGVSRGTVDRVLHNRGGVKQDVADHIRNIAGQMGYLPNRAGKLLAARKQPLTVGCLIPSIGNDYFLDVIRGLRTAEAELRDFGIAVEVREVRGFYPEAHVKALREMEKKGYSALCVSSADTPEIRNCLNGIIRSGTPVITIDTDISDTDRVCYVGSHYVVAGRTAGGLLARAMPAEPVNLVIATGSLNVKCHRERISGFEQVLHEKKIKYTVHDLFETQDDDEIGYRRASAILAAHPDIDWIYSTSAGVGGICKAVMELDKKQRKHLRIICFDDTAVVRKYMRKGVIDYAICQEPKQQGYQAIKRVFDYFMDGCKGTMDDYITRAVIKIEENLTNR